MRPATAFLLKNKALHYPVFRNFLLVRMSVILALNMQATIVSYFVYYKLTYNPNTHTGDPLVLGILGLCEVIPAIGFSLFSGHFVDISEKKKMMFWCILGYIMLSVFYVVLSWPGINLNLPVNKIIWLAYSGIFIGGALRAFLSPASFALQGLLIPRELYSNATTWSSASWQMGAVVGPLFGGFMILSGYNTALITVGVVEIISLVALLRIPRQQIMKKDKEPIMRSLGEGLKFVFKSQIILAVLSLDMFAVLFGGAVALLPVYAVDILKVGEIGFGWMRAAPGIGSVICLLILSFIPLNKQPGIKLMLCIAGFGITTVVFGYCGRFGTGSLFSITGFRISWGFIIAFFMLLLGGMFDAVSVVIRGTVLQLNTPESMRGRVAAVNTMFISSSNELGAMESGITARWMGTVPAVVFGGLMTLAVVGVTWFAAPMLRTLKLAVDKKKD